VAFELSAGSTGSNNDGGGSMKADRSGSGRFERSGMDAVLQLQNLHYFYKWYNISKNKA